MKQLGQGIRHFFSATSFLSKHGLLYFYLFPLALSLLLYIALSTAIVAFSKYITTLLLGDYLPKEGIQNDGTSSFLSFFSGDTITTIVSIIVGVIIFLISAKLSKYVVLILLSPVFALLSEIVDEKMTGKKYPFNLYQLLKDILRGSLIALRNLSIELLLIGAFSLLGFAAGPFSLLVVPVLWLVSAYFYGFSMMDYTCERRKMSVGQSIEFIRRNRGIAVGNGAMYTLLDLIPIVGLTIAPINAVVGATTAIIESENAH
ncbi:MAG: EI24 domain-containing protein [Bacteroidota bacterium]